MHTPPRHTTLSPVHYFTVSCRKHAVIRHPMDANHHEEEFQLSDLWIKYDPLRMTRATLALSLSADVVLYPFVRFLLEHLLCRLIIALEKSQPLVDRLNVNELTIL